ncbi:lipopolysaccharide heptosyltransferase II [Olivibacter ginsenosidimutans]|uniref:Lipopolysaccharide heptosyltransferase II n=1 Tax=Olivibacter ginsenosidimutans TaxID=1176537 RepID=A0ABP9AIF6_9SPHI
MKILVRLPNWLGDVIMGTAFIHELRKQYPHAAIHVIAKKELADIVHGIAGISQIHLFSKTVHPGARGALRFGRLLKSYRFDLFFSLPDSFSAALMGYATGAKKRVGFKSEMRSFLFTKTYKKPDGLHRVEEYLYLLEQFTGKKQDQPRVSLLPPNEKDTKRDLILVNFNSEASSRRLPLDKAVSLTKKLAQELPDCQLGFIGSPKESAYITAILAQIPSTGRVRNYAGKTSLKELMVLLASCRILLSTDSGPAHVANSFDTPCLVLFGAGNEKNTRPYNQDHLRIIRAGKLACEPCVKNTCTLYPTPECMHLLDEQLIIDELKAVLTHE